MLKRIKRYFKTHPDRASFFTIIGTIFPKYSVEYKLIEDAYHTAKEAFREKYRDDGDRYFEHLRAVALLLLLHLRVRDANVIAAALLHDIVEDILGWDQDVIAKRFNPKVAVLVFWVSKEKVEMYGGDKEKRNRAYHQKLSSAPREAVLIKLADRLHNLLTLWVQSANRQTRKIRETQDFYLPLAESHTILIHELESVIDKRLADLT